MPALTEVNLVTAAAIFVIGLLAGALTARLVLPSRKKIRELSSALDDARNELAAYRASVSDHFEKTSELVATMTASYKAVYDHLAVGAQTLCEDNAALAVGRFAAPRLVLDQDLTVAGATATTAAAATGVTQPPGRPDAPILEMQRENRSMAPQDSAQTKSLVPAEQRADDADSSPLH